MYVMTPGWISSCPPPTAFGWPPILNTNPNFNGGQKYTTDTVAYMNYLLDDTAAMGVDFIMVDMSNGVRTGSGDYYTCANTGARFTASLLQLLDIADQRLQQKVKTPHIAIWSPVPGTLGSAPGDADWIYANIVRNLATGLPRPSYVWMNGLPLWGVWSPTLKNPRQQFTTTFADSRFFVRYICDSANGDCNQQQVNKGTVWPWSTFGNLAPTGAGVEVACPASANSTSSCPLASGASNEITIQNGYQDAIGCTYYWPAQGITCTPKNGTIVGFEFSYYTDQWNFAFAAANTPAGLARVPEIVLISTYDEIEGGWIQSSHAYETSTGVQNPAYWPANIYEQMTQNYVIKWKGGTTLANMGPPDS
jgi:hypothetical protein